MNYARKMSSEQNMYFTLRQWVDIAAGEGTEQLEVVVNSEMRRADNLTTFMCWLFRNSRSLNLQEP